MYLTDYVKKFGCFSFKEKPFNDVDAAVLATAVYSNFEVVAPTIYDKGTKASTFGEISNFDFSVVTAGKITVSGNKKMIAELRKAPRFSSIGIRYVYKVLSQDFDNQFYAATFIIPDVGLFIAFRGTDSSIAGWKENFNLSTRKVVLSQLDAMDYLATVARLENGPIYLGGHSKGGNLSLYASIFVDKYVQDRIVKAYSFDGNGLNDKDVFQSNKYLSINDRFTLIRPVNSVIGQLMNNPESNLFVKSKKHYILQHDPHTWKIDKEGRFILQSKARKASYIRHISTELWLSRIDDKSKTVLFDFLSKFLGGDDEIIFDFLSPIRKLSIYLKIRKTYNKEERKQMKRAIKDLFTSKRETRRTYKN